MKYGNFNLAIFSCCPQLRSNSADKGIVLHRLFYDVVKPSILTNENRLSDFVLKFNYAMDQGTTTLHIDILFCGLYFQYRDLVT